MNCIHFLRESAQRWPGEPAVYRIGPGDVWLPPVTYRQLDRTVDRVASRARAAGLEPGQLAQVAVDGHYRSLVVTLALARLGVGACTGPAAPGMVAAFVREGAGPTRGGVRAIEVGPGWTVPPADDEPIDVVPDHDDPDALMLVLGSSGTTGLPKAIGCTHRAFAARLSMAERFIQLPRPRIVCPLGPYGAYAIRHYFTALAAGGSIALAKTANGALDAIERFSLQVAALPPNLLHDIVHRLRPNGVPLPSLYCVEASGSRLPAPLRERVQARLCERIAINYGSTEAGVVACAWASELAGHADAVGRVVDGVDVEAVDGDGRPLPRGATGAIRVRSPGGAAGYLGAPDATAVAFRDGWFYSGDIGSVSADGLLSIVGREDEVINAGGRKAHPSAIEDALLRQPGVADAAAFGVPDAHGLVRFAAAIVTAPGFDAKQFEENVRRELGVIAPKLVLRVAALPRNANGKVQRDTLVDLALEQRDPART